MLKQVSKCSKDPEKGEESLVQEQVTGASVPGKRQAVCRSWQVPVIMSSDENWLGFSKERLFVFTSFPFLRALLGSWVKRVPETNQWELVQL